MFKKESRLTKRNNIFYIRAVVPSSLKNACKKSEITYSLKTSDYKKAISLCRIESAKIDCYFRDLEMKIREDNSLELTDNDYDAIQIDRLSEIEYERKINLKYCDHLPENEFGLFTKEKFTKWIKEDSAYPDREMRIEPQVFETENGLEYEEGLSVNSDEFQTNMIIEWFLSYLRKIRSTDKTLGVSTIYTIKQILDGKIKLKLFHKGKLDALAVLKNKIIPLEEYANEKAIAEYKKEPYAIDNDIEILLDSIKQKKIIEKANAKIGKRTEPIHWTEIWKIIEIRKQQEHQSPKAIKATRERLDKIFKLIGKEYLNDIIIDDCDILNEKIYGITGKDISPKTAKTYLIEFKHLMKEARKRDSTILDVQDLVYTPSLELIESRKIQRRTFDEKSLISIFSNKNFLNKRYNYKDFPKFWVPLIMLYLPVRENEVCQIELSNIRKIDNIYVMIITDNGETQKLKNSQSERIIPIHSKLIEIGFIDLVKKIKKNREFVKKWISRSSSTLHHNSSGTEYYPQHNENGVFYPLTLTDNGYIGKVSKYFNRLLTKLGLKDTINEISGAKERLVGHCFRHTVASILSNEDVSDTQIDQLCGWKVKGMRGNYIHSDIKSLKEKIEKISYPEFEEKVIPLLMPDKEKEKNFLSK